MCRPHPAPSLCQWQQVSCHTLAPLLTTTPWPQVDYMPVTVSESSAQRALFASSYTIFYFKVVQVGVVLGEGGGLLLTGADVGSRQGVGS